MSFEDETDELLEQRDCGQTSCDTDGLTPAEVVDELRRESREDFLDYGSPIDPNDPDIPHVQRHG